MMKDGEGARVGRQEIKVDSAVSSLTILGAASLLGPLIPHDTEIWLLSIVAGKQVMFSFVHLTHTRLSVQVM